MKARLSVPREAASCSAAKAKWTDQQMLFINQLYLFTVMMLTGKVQLEKDGEKQVVVQAGGALNRDRMRPGLFWRSIKSASMRS